MVLSARSTLNVLKADTLPRSTNSVTYLQQAGRQKHRNTQTEGCDQHWTLGPGPETWRSRERTGIDGNSSSCATEKVKPDIWSFTRRPNLEKKAPWPQIFMLWTRVWPPTRKSSGISGDVASTLQWAEPGSTQNSHYKHGPLEDKNSLTCSKTKKSRGVPQEIQKSLIHPRSVFQLQQKSELNQQIYNNSAFIDFWLL